MVDMEWKVDWFFKSPQSYWDSLENQQRIVSQIGSRLGITQPKDWGKVSTREFRDLGGASLLNRFNNSLIACLQSLYEGFYLWEISVKIQTSSGKENGLCQFLDLASHIGIMKIIVEHLLNVSQVQIM